MEILINDLKRKLKESKSIHNILDVNGHYFLVSKLKPFVSTLRLKQNPIINLIDEDSTLRIRYQYGELNLKSIKVSEDKMRYFVKEEYYDSRVNNWILADVSRTIANIITI